MAEIVASIPIKASSRYPWDEWFDGQARKLTRGVDFTCDTFSFRNCAKAAGRSRKLSIEAVIRGQSVYVQSNGAAK